MKPSLTDSLPTQCLVCVDALQRGEPEASSWGRRNFLKATARAVLLVEASGLPWREMSSSVARAAEPVGLVRVALADFPALAAVSGSVHLNVAASPGLYPVILTRTSASVFAAVSSQCTHSGCIVDTLSAGLGTLVCPCHGSQFTAQGAVVFGPAAVALTAYTARLVSPTVVEVEIPGIGFAVAGAFVNTAAGRRMRLTFPTATALRYELKRRTSLTTAATAVTFSLTETGATTQTQLTGTGTDATLYVDAEAAAGFLSVVRF